jgi:glycosyltransferase involved in cell wall biosynthesis
VHRPNGLIGKVMAKIATRLDQGSAQLGKAATQGWFSSAWLPDQLHSRLVQLQPDIVNLHWVNNGLMRLETLRRLDYPIVWTLHDMWSFTGGCHYTGGCNRYNEMCGQCPQLGSHSESDLSRRVWLRKASAWKYLRLQIVTPSSWMADCARASALFRERTIETIPYGLDIDIFKPLDRGFARHALNLPNDKLIILFGADSGTADSRKGFDLLSTALNYLARDEKLRPQILLAVFGRSLDGSGKTEGFETRYMGKLQDDASLALLYSAADVFVAPSREDNLPNTILEAMACGTPCAAFCIGGMPDMIVPGETGYLAAAFDPEDLARGIRQLLISLDKVGLRMRNRNHATEKFGLMLQAERYQDLYQTMK